MPLRVIVGAFSRHEALVDGLNHHQADDAEQAARRSSGERQRGSKWHLLGPPIGSTLA